jgi:hypothetical protein
MAKQFTITHEKTRELILKCVNLQQELMREGLFETYHKMHDVTRAVGWEVAQVLEGKHVTKLVCPHGYIDFDDCPDCRH